jgi:sugar phosphate isomerase/epimerase
MTQSLIAAQLYTLREHCRTAAELAASLKKVRAIGYESVQISGIGPIDPKDVARILQDNQLTCCITHIGLDQMRNEFDAVLEKHRLWDCQYAAIGGLFPREAYTRQLWQSFIDEYNQLATRFAATGLTIGYHNHSHELARVDGTTPMQMLVDGLQRPAFIEIDTYWITHGGGDPIAWIDKCTGRLPCLHLKDMAITSDRQQRMAPVGEGNLNFPGIISAATRAGTRWFIVEQDDCYGRDPFECLAASYRNLREMGLR